jgi:glyoxylase-like metal-dependent hydrolase (beta-lactamase superfamily II)
MAALKEIEPGLWRWSAPHPGWRPGATPQSPDDWPRAVGSVLCDAPDATVLIDPLLPHGDERLLSALDQHVGRRERPVVVLTTIGFHRRSRDQLVDRYGATTSRAKRNLPAGVESFPIRGAGETIFWLRQHRALVPGDRIIGAPGARLRLCPESWLRYLSSGITLAGLAEALRPLLDLEIERVLVSHGEPVLSGGRRKLAKALG